MSDGEVALLELECGCVLAIGLARRCEYTRARPHSWAEAVLQASELAGEGLTSFTVLAKRLREHVLLELHTMTAELCDLECSCFTTGWESGQEDGYDKGYNDGHEAGRKEGYEEGYKAGETDGYRAGYADARLSLRKKC
jgi:hypothetical protein